MTWVRVQCSGGMRYAAPSFSEPPSLEGFDKLFSAPEMELRGVHCFPARDRPFSRAPAESAAHLGARLDSEEVHVLFDAVALGGRVGTATIAVGGPSEVGSMADAFSSHDGADDDTELRLLLARTKTVLRSTGESGVAVLLDALCTRLPVPYDPYEEVVEDDGLYTRGHDPRLVRGAAGHGATARGGGGNREFLLRVLPAALGGVDDRLDRERGAASDSAHGDGRDSTSVRRSPLSLPGCPSAAVAPPTDHPFGYALGELGVVAARRRRGLLGFTVLDAVPLSLLFSAPLGGPREKSPSAKQLSPAAARSTQSLGEAVSFLAGSPWKDHHAPSTQPRLTGSYWTSYAARAAESATALMRAVQMVLRNAFPKRDSAFVRDMWNCSPSASGGGGAAVWPPALPFAAAYSPSGLLLASPGFWAHMRHEMRVILSAVAVDGLCWRRTAPRNRTLPGDEHQESALGEWVLRMESLPLLSSPSSSSSSSSSPATAAQVMEVGVLSVGDALSFIFGFPTGSQPAAATTSAPAGAAAPSWGMAPLMRYVQAMQCAAGDCATQSVAGGVGAAPQEELGDGSEESSSSTRTAPEPASPPPPPPSSAVAGTFGVAAGTPLDHALAIIHASTLPHGSDFARSVLAIKGMTLHAFVQQTFSTPAGAPRGDAAYAPAEPSARPTDAAAAAAAAHPPCQQQCRLFFASQARKRGERRHRRSSAGGTAGLQEQEDDDPLATPPPAGLSQASMGFVQLCYVAARVTALELEAYAPLADAPVDSCAWLAEQVVGPAASAQEPTVTAQGEATKGSGVASGFDAATTAAPVERCRYLVGRIRPPLESPEAAACGTVRDPTRLYRPLSAVVAAATAGAFPSGSTASGRGCMAAATTTLLPSCLLNDVDSDTEDFTDSDSSSSSSSSGSVGQETSGRAGILTCLTQVSLCAGVPAAGERQLMATLLCVQGSRLQDADALHELLEETKLPQKAESSKHRTASLEKSEVYADNGGAADGKRALTALTRLSAALPSCRDASLAVLDGACTCNQRAQYAGKLGS